MTWEPLVDIWGTSSDDIFVLGSAGTFLRYDGSSWTSLATAPSVLWPRAIWGTSPQDIFMVDQRSIYYYDGAGWQRVYTGGYGLQDIWGSSNHDIFVVTERGVVFHYDGSSWTEQSLQGQISPLNGIWGTSGSDVFAVGGSPHSSTGVILHYDGTSWTQMAGSTRWDPLGSLYAVWGSSSTDVFAAGDDGVLHYDGVTWTLVKPYTAFAVWGSSSTDVYAAGAEGIILHFDGITWTEQETWISTGRPDFYAVWGTSDHEVFIVGGGDRDDVDKGSLIYRYDGASWKFEAPALIRETGIKLAGVGGSSATDIYFVGEWQNQWASIVHFNGTYIDFSIEELRGFVWTDISVAAQDAVFVVASEGRLVGRFDGSTWHYIYYLDLEGPQPAVWASSGTSAFVVGDYGRACRYDGTAWNCTTTGTTSMLFDVWGASSTDVFAVGGGGAICHFDGVTWELMRTEVTHDLYAVWGNSGQDVFAVGEAGIILHFDGSEWHPMTNPMPTDLSGIWGSSENDIFAVGPPRGARQRTGARGVVLHYDGVTWKLMSNSIGGSGVWGSSGSDVYVIDEVRVFHYGPEQPDLPLRRMSVEREASKHP